MLLQPILQDCPPVVVPAQADAYHITVCGFFDGMTRQ